MTSFNFFPCKICKKEFREDELVGNREPDLCCQECLNNFEFTQEYKRIREISKKIIQILDKDKETNPDIYGEIFFDIMLLGNIPNKDKKRYFDYSLKEAEKRLNKFIESK